MARFFKSLFTLLLVCLGFAAYSYLGARFTAGRMLGNDSPLTDRTIVFAYKGAPQLPGKHRVWVFTYRRSRLPGVEWAQIFISFNGRLVATRPADLEQRLAVWERSRLP